MDFSTLKTRQEDDILYVTLDNAPCNLITITMATELFQLVGYLMTDTTTKVVVFDSANPDFFIAHFDANDIVNGVESDTDTSVGTSEDLNVMQGLALSIQGLPQVTIAKVDGVCRGGGLEFILSLDMRFVSERSKFCFPEATANFLPAGGGTTFMPLIAGKARALEVILTCRDFTGKEASDYGFANCALADTAALEEYVDKVAKNIARLSPETIQSVYNVMNTFTKPMIPQIMATLKVEHQAMMDCLGKPETLEWFKAMAEKTGTPETEKDLPKTLDDILRNMG